MDGDNGYDFSKPDFTKEEAQAVLVANEEFTEADASMRWTSSIVVATSTTSMRKSTSHRPTIEQGSRC